MQSIKNNMLIFTVNLDPEPQKKTRFKSVNGKHWAYDPTATYISRLKWQIQAYQSSELYMGPIEIDLTFFLPIPVGTSKVKRRLMNNGTIYHIKRPDQDNLAYPVVNAMKGIIYDDDSQVVSARYRKFYSDQPRIVVKVRDLVGQIFTPDC